MVMEVGGDVARHAVIGQTSHGKEVSMHGRHVQDINQKWSERVFHQGEGPRWEQCPPQRRSVLSPTARSALGGLVDRCEVVEQGAVIAEMRGSARVEDPVDGIGTGQSRRGNAICHRHRRLKEGPSNVDWWCGSRWLRRRRGSGHCHRLLLGIPSGLLKVRIVEAVAKQGNPCSLKTDRVKVVLALAVLGRGPALV